MSYKVTVIADFNGRMYLGADKRPEALAAASPIAEVKLYGSQIPFAISAKAPDGRVIITTKRKAKKNGWVALRDSENRLIGEYGETSTEQLFPYSTVIEARREALATGIEWCAEQLPESLALVKAGWLAEAKAFRESK
jgi:hypothetical protein